MIDRFDQSIQLFRALSDPTRLRLIHLLQECPQQQGYCVNRLAALLGVSQPAVSQHLRVLRHLGLVSGERKGYKVHYTIDRERLEVLRDLADETLRCADKPPKKD